jgi:hypothetical protein
MGGKHDQKDVRNCDETGYDMMEKVYHDASQPFQVVFSLFGDDGNVYDFIHSRYVT